MNNEKTNLGQREGTGRASNQESPDVEVTSSMFVMAGLSQSLIFSHNQ